MRFMISDEAFFWVPVYNLDYAHDQGVERLSARLMLPVVE